MDVWIAGARKYGAHLSEVVRREQLSAENVIRGQLINRTGLAPQKVVIAVVGFPGT